MDSAPVETSSQPQVNDWMRSLVPLGLFDLGWDPVNGRHTTTQLASRGSFPKLFAGGGRVTQEDLDRNNWRWANIDELQDDDPLFKAIDPTDSRWIVDNAGRLVPKSTVNNWLNSYERQTPYQPQNDSAADEWIRQRMQHRLNQEFNRQVDNFFMGNWARTSQLIGAFNPHGDDLGIPFSQRLFLGTGNTGIVSPEFMQEHPYIGEGLNMVFDMAAPGALQYARGLTNAVYDFGKDAYNHSGILLPYIKGELGRHIPITSAVDAKIRYKTLKDPSLKAQLDNYLEGGLVEGLPTVDSKPLPEITKEIISKDVLGRWKAARAKEGYPMPTTEFGIDKANALLEDTEWYEFPKAAFDVAGKNDWNAFTVPSTIDPFISVNGTRGLPELTSLPHDFLHILDGQHLVGPIKLTDG